MAKLSYVEMAEQLEAVARANPDRVKRARGLALAQIGRALAKMPFMQKPGEASPGPLYKDGKPLG